MTDVTSYLIGWTTLIIASLLVSLVGFYWLRLFSSFFLSLLSSTLLFVFLTIPAPIPNYEGYFAPAYTVFIFETFFQIKGSSMMSGQVLVLALFSALILIIAGRYFHIKQRDKGITRL